MHGKLGLSLTLAAGLCVSTALHAQQTQSPPLNQAQQLIFTEPHMQGLPTGSTINYRFESQVQGTEAFSDRVLISVTGIAENGGRDLSFDFLSGEHHIDFSPAKGYRGNPLIVHFLERDIRDMALITGGFNGYFRNRIRKSFARSNTRPLRIAINGAEMDAIEVSITPFIDDPHGAGMKHYANKQYRFVFAKEIPGGLYRIQALVPGDGDILMNEQLTFTGLHPAG